MTHRRRRILSQQAVAKALEAAKEMHLAACAVCASAPIDGPEYAAASRVNAAVHALADTLSGKKDFLFARLHSAGG